MKSEQEKMDVSKYRDVNMDKEECKDFRLNKFKFAHIADCHLGRWNKEPHKSNEINAFELAIKTSVSEKVDFILISGDLFDSTVPNLDTADKVFELLKYVKDKGIEIYMIFGSHDNSRNRQSIAKLLSTSGIVNYVGGPAVSTGQPMFFKDKKTGALITGIDGLTGGTESQIYDEMDRELLEEMEGFKIFMFHSAINEYLPENLWMIEGIDLDKFPEGFDYYAGGHIHRMAITGDEKHHSIAYPGPLYGADYRDFQKTAEGESKGFYLVEVEDGTLEINFMEIEIDEFIYHEIKLHDLTAQQIRKKLDEFNPDVKGKNVMIKLTGTLKGGSEGELHINEFNKRLKKAGARDVLTNIRGVTVELEEINVKRVEGMGKEEIENLILSEEQEKFDKGHIGMTNDDIMGDNGIKKGKQLIEALREEKKHKEKKGDYENRVCAEAMHHFKVAR